MKVIGLTSKYQSCADNELSALGEIFLMADSSLVKDGKPFFIPDYAEQFDAVPAMVIRMSRLGKNIASKFATRYYDAVTVGMMLTAQPMYDTLLQSGASTDAARSFDGAAILGDFRLIDANTAIDNLQAQICVDDAEQWNFDTSTWDFDFNRLVQILSKYYTIKIGDLVFVAVPGAPPLTLARNMCITGTAHGEELLKFRVK